MNIQRNPRSFFGLAAFACAVAFSLSTSPSLAQQSLQVLHNHVSPTVASSQTALVGALPATQQLNITLVLPLRNQNALTTLLGKLYDPTSPNYRQYLSVAQFTDQFGPTAADYNSVVSFAKANGFTITDTPANRLIIPVTATVSQINQAFNLSLNTYQHPTENRTFFSPNREPSLALSVPLAHIVGLDNFTLPQPLLARSATAQPSPDITGSGPGGYYLGSDIRAAYYGGSTLTGAGQTVGLLEYGGYNLSDVNLMFSTAGQSYNVPIVNVLLDGEGPGPNGNYDAEEVLDIAEAIGVAPGLSQVRVYIGSLDVDIFNKIATENLAKQSSISWVWGENAAADDPIFQELAAQGQSLFAAAGDWGSFPSQSVALYFPPEDAYLTSVGGTDLLTNGTAGPWLSESAWSYSGGGISPDGIEIPSWQAGVANSANGASTTLRNVPDIAGEANFDYYVCQIGTCGGGWGGTSFAAPIWAAFTALVNQQAVAAGNSTVGFLNPALYTLGKSANYNSDFHDIASGSNGGYNAVTGYDLVTGWGTPNGQNLINDLAGASIKNGNCHIVYTSGTPWLGGDGISGFNGSITINNTGTSPITSWNLAWTFPGTQTIQNLWNGTVTQTGEAVTVTNLSYNGSISAGGSYNGIGFTGSFTTGTNNNPPSFTLNGSPCN